MKRKIVKIDEEKCNGCGLCIDACHEGALQLVDGKARLVSESYCDGLGDCLPECPADAITIEERVALPFDEEAVKKYMDAQKQAAENTLACGCPGTDARIITPDPGFINLPASPALSQPAAGSQLRQWPCQIKLVPVNAPYFDNAHLLIAADCTAYAYPGIHNDYMKNKITLIGCPKLDDVEYADKLTQILSQHELKSITVLRMEVPCCTGLVNSVKKAIKDSGQIIPWSIVTISTDGRVLEPH
ncbi:ferredoxin 3 fused to putative domain [hydrocarbon metagenome]|uniref:Ferredoxin 3 fused to putative domain n=1 Tax=hydrocarbon metagenome TaxID=938273 RepID=A0A0W8E309_9ZZZZ